MCVVCVCTNFSHNICIGTVWSVLFVHSLSNAVTTISVGIPHEPPRDHSLEKSNSSSGKNAGYFGVTTMSMC